MNASDMMKPWEQVMTLYYVHATQAYTDTDLSGCIVEIDAVFQVRDRDDV